jgi:hypothetical protein
VAHAFGGIGVGRVDGAGRFAKADQAIARLNHVEQQRARGGRAKINRQDRIGRSVFDFHAG